MRNVKKSQVNALPVNDVTSPNNRVEWQDQDIADAFIEKGKSHGVTISPDTAQDIANEVRQKVKKNDVLELHAIIKEIIDNLFPKSPEMAATHASLEILKVIGRRVEKYRTILAQEEGESNGPIGPEEEADLRAGILNDILIPLQEGIQDKVADATRKLMRDLLPLQQEKNQLEAELGDDAHVKVLYDTYVADPSNRENMKLYKKETKGRNSKVSRAIELLNQINVIKSKLILLDSASNYVDKHFRVMDQYRGVDGMSRYFENVLQPGIQNVKDLIISVRRNIVLPEVDARTRHERAWIMRHHNTKSYQNKGIGPDVDNITFEEFEKSPVYKELKSRGVDDNKIKDSLRNLDAKPMTWRKGQAIYMLLDPPSEKTVNKDIPTLMEPTPENVKDEEGKVVQKAWSDEIITNQPFNIESGKFDEQKDKMEKGTRPRAMSKERKVSEAANEDAHWSVLFNLSRNQKVDASGKTRAEKYLESLPEKMRENPKVLETVKNMENEDHLNDKEIIYSALWNPNTPDWVLMKAALTGYAETTRRIAKAILERKRGWQPKLENGELVKDEETNDYVWERVPGFDKGASFDARTVVAQAATAPAAPNPAAQQAQGQQQAYQNQINSIDQQMKTHQQQMQQLQVQKTDLEKQRDSIRVPQQPQQPAQQASPSSPGTGMPPAQPMAADNISFRKLSQYYKKDVEVVEPEAEFSEPTEPEEGDFVYDDATSGLSIHGEKFLGKFIEWNDVEAAIREYASRHQWFPNVWKISDHGNAHLVQDFNYGL